MLMPIYQFISVVRGLNFTLVYGRSNTGSRTYNEVFLGTWLEVSAIAAEVVQNLG